MAIGLVSGDSAFVPNVIPNVGIIVDAPAPMFDSRRFMAIHTRCTREAAQTALKWFFAKRLGFRFTMPARSALKHKERQLPYKAIKRRRFNSITDLVASGRTKQKMLGTMPKVTIAKNTEGITHATLKLRFPFPVASDPQDPRHVTVAQMAKEIKTLLPHELNTMADIFEKVYLEALIRETQNQPRFRKKIGAAFHNQLAASGLAP